MDFSKHVIHKHILSLFLKLLFMLVYSGCAKYPMTYAYHVVKHN